MRKSLPSDLQMTEHDCMRHERLSAGWHLCGACDLINAHDFASPQHSLHVDLKQVFTGADVWAALSTAHSYTAVRRVQILQTPPAKTANPHYSPDLISDLSCIEYTLHTLAGDLTALQHADVAALAAVMALLPVENADEGEQDADEQALGAPQRLPPQSLCRILPSPNVGKDRERKRRSWSR